MTVRPTTYTRTANACMHTGPCDEPSAIRQKATFRCRGCCAMSRPKNARRRDLNRDQPPTECRSGYTVASSRRKARSASGARSSIPPTMQVMCHKHTRVNLAFVRVSRAPTVMVTDTRSRCEAPNINPGIIVSEETSNTRRVSKRSINRNCNYAGNE